MATAKDDKFDFLIDIVPRDEIKAATSSTKLVCMTDISVGVCCYFCCLGRNAARHRSVYAETAKYVSEYV